MAFTTETGFNTTLSQKLDAGTADTEIKLAALPITVTSGVMLIGSGTNKEWVYFGTSDTGSVEIRTCKRGLDKDATATTDVTTSNILSHRVGDPVRLVQHSLEQNNKPDIDDTETITGDWTYTGANDFQSSLKVPVFADATARDAEITSPANGMLAYLTDTGVMYQYIGGAWATFATGTVVNASDTVAGKVEKATSAESKAGTDTGGTGAQNFVAPSDIAANTQNQQFTHAVDSVGTDAYAITLAPAISAYSDGQQFTFEAGTANTGACTLAVNGLAAKAIKKNNDADLETGDIEAGQKVLVCFDEDNDYFQMQSQLAQEPYYKTIDDPQKYWRVYPTPVGYGGSADALNWAASVSGTGTTTPSSSVGYVITATQAANGAYEGFYRAITPKDSGIAADTQNLSFDDFSTGDVVIFRLLSKNVSDTPSDHEVRFGIGEDLNDLHSDVGSKTVAKFKMDDTTWTVETCDGTGALTSQGITVDHPLYANMFEIRWTVGTSVVFKVNDVVVHTATTNIPLNTDNGTLFFFCGNKATAAAIKQVYFDNEPYIAISK